MATNIEIDQMLKKGIRLLHSTSTNSATELRQMLDEIIKQRYGSEKMLCNTLSKKQLEEEPNFLGRIATPTPQQIQEDEIINLTHSPAKTISDSPDTILDSDDGVGGTSALNSNKNILTIADEDVNLKDFGDLYCCVCGEMMFTANNRLIECSKCCALYHQECHKPPISNEDASDDRERQWQCDNCVNKPTPSKSPTILPNSEVVVIPDEPTNIEPSTKTNTKSTNSSSSSNSSSPFYKGESTNKHGHRSSSVTTSSQRDDTRTSKSKNTIVTPTINIISADRSSSHSRRSHTTSSSKSSKSRHHESSRRKSSK